jgi:hypothetical protein
MKNSFQTWPPRPSSFMFHVRKKETLFELNFVHNCFRFHRKSNTCREKCQSLLFRDAGTIWEQGIYLKAAIYYLSSWARLKPAAWNREHSMVWTGCWLVCSRHRGNPQAKQNTTRKTYMKEVQNS